MREVFLYLVNLGGFKNLGVLRCEMRLRFTCCSSTTDQSAMVPTSKRPS